MPVKIDGAFYDIDSASGDVLNQLKAALRLDDITYHGFTKQSGARVGRDPRAYDDYQQPPYSRIVSNPEHLYYDATGLLWTEEGDVPVPYDPHNYDDIPHGIGPDPALNRHGWVYNFSCRADYIDVSNDAGRLRFEREAAAPTTLDIRGYFWSKRWLRADRGFDLTWQFRELPDSVEEFQQLPLLGSAEGFAAVLITKESGSSNILALSDTGVIGGPAAIPDATSEIDVHFSWDPQTATATLSYTIGGVHTQLATRTFTAELPLRFVNLVFSDFPNYDAGIPGNLVANFGLNEPVYHPERNDASGRYAPGLEGVGAVERSAGPYAGIFAGWWRPLFITTTGWEDLSSVSPLLTPPAGVTENALVDVEADIQVGAGVYADSGGRRVLTWSIIDDRSRMEWQEDIVPGLSKYRCGLRTYSIPLPTGLDEDDIFMGDPAVINGAVCLVFGVKYASGDGQEGIYILDFHADALLHITKDNAYYEMTGLGSGMLHGFFTAISSQHLGDEFRAPALVRDHTPANNKPAAVHNAVPTADLSDFGDAFLLGRREFLSASQAAVAPHQCFAFKVAYADMGTLLITGYEDVQVFAPPIGLQSDARRWNFSGFLAGPIQDNAYSEGQGPTPNKNNLTGIGMAPLGVPSLWYPTARFGGSPTQNGYPRMTPFHQIPGWFFLTQGNMSGNLFKYLSAQGYARYTNIPTGMGLDEFLEQQKNALGAANVGDAPATLGLGLSKTIGRYLAQGRVPVLTDAVQQYDTVLVGPETDGDIIALDTFNAASALFDPEISVGQVVEVTAAGDALNIKEVTITEVLDTYTVKVTPDFNSTESGVTWNHLSSPFELTLEGTGDEGNEIEAADVRKHLGVIAVVVCSSIRNFYRVKNAYPHPTADDQIVIALAPLLLDGESASSFALPRNDAAYLSFMPMPWNVDIDGLAVQAVPVAFQRATDLTDPETIRYWILLRSVDGSVAELRRYQFNYDYDAQKLKAIFDRRFIQTAADQAWVGDEDFLSRSATQDFFMLGSENLTEASATLYGAITGREVEVTSGSEEKDRPYYFLKGTCWNWRDTIGLTWTMRLTTASPTTDGTVIPSPPSADNTTVLPLGAGTEIRLGAQPQDNMKGPVAHVSLLQQTAPYTMPRQGETGDSAAGFMPGLEGEGEWVDATTFRAIDDESGPPVFSSFLEDTDPSVAERLLVVYDQTDSRKRLLLRVEEILDGNTATVSTDLNEAFKSFADLLTWTSDIPVSERVEGTRFSWFFFIWRGAVSGGKLTFPNVFQATRKPFGGRLAFADAHVGDFIEVALVMNPAHFFPDKIPDTGYTTAYWASGDDTVYLREDLGEVFTRGMLGHALYLGGTEDEVYSIVDLIEELDDGTFRGAVLEEGGGAASFTDDQTAQVARFDSNVVENGVKGKIDATATPDEFLIEPYTSGAEIAGTEDVTYGTYWAFAAAEATEITGIAAGMKVLLAVSGWFLVEEIEFDTTTGEPLGLHLVEIDTGAAWTGGGPQGWTVYEVAEMRNYFSKLIAEASGVITVLDRAAHGTDNDGEHTIDDIAAGTEILAPAYPTHRPEAYAGVELDTATRVDQSDLSWKMKGLYQRWEIAAVLSETSVELDVPTQADFDTLAAFSFNGRYAWKHVTKRLQCPGANFVALDADQKKLTLDKSGDPNLDGFEFDIEEVESATQVKVDHYFDAPLLNSGAMRWGVGDVPYATVAYLPASTTITTAINGGVGGVYVLFPRGGTLPTLLAGKYLYLNFPYLDAESVYDEGLFGDYSDAYLTLSPALNSIAVEVTTRGNDGTYGDWALLDLDTDSPLLEPLNDAAEAQVYAWPVNAGYTQAEYVPALYTGEAKHVYADTLAANWFIFQNPAYMRAAGLGTPDMCPLCYMELSTTRENEQTKVTVTRHVVGKERTEEEGFYDGGVAEAFTQVLDALPRYESPAAPGATFGHRGDKFPVSEGYFLRVSFALITFSTTSQHRAEEQLEDLVGVPELLEASPAPGYAKTTLWIGSNADQQGEIVAGDQDRILELRLRTDEVRAKTAYQLDSAEVLGSLVEHTRHGHGTMVSAHLQTDAPLFFSEDLTLEDLQEWYSLWV